MVGGVTINQAPLTITASDSRRCTARRGDAGSGFGSVGLYEQGLVNSEASVRLAWGNVGCDLERDDCAELVGALTPSSATGGSFTASNTRYL